MNSNMAIKDYHKIPMLGWSDYLTVEKDGKPERRKLKDWLTSDPCAVIEQRRVGGPYLRYPVYRLFQSKACDCED
jgi:hypothetical protein